jgi:hypothetical protein
MSAQTVSTGATARTLSLPLRSPLPKTATKKVAGLRIVPQRRSSAAKAPFVVVLVSLLVGGLLGLLLLNTLIAQGSFRLHDLSNQGRALELRQQDLQRQVQALQAPAELAHRAAALGMVPGNAPAFLRLSDGKVLGLATAGLAPAGSAQPKAPTPASPTRATRTAATTPAKPGTRPAAAQPAGTTPGAHR